MELPSHSEIVELLDDFLARHEMKPSRLGRDALGEPQFVSEVRAGRTPGLATLGKLKAFMRRRDGEVVTATASTAATARAHRLSAGGR